MTKPKPKVKTIVDQVSDAWSNILTRAQRDSWRIAAGVVPKPSSSTAESELEHSINTDSRP